jgi:hypothetical protein
MFESSDLRFPVWVNSCLWHSFAQWQQISFNTYGRAHPICMAAASKTSRGIEKTVDRRRMKNLIT